MTSHSREVFLAEVDFAMRRLHEVCDGHYSVSIVGRYIGEQPLADANFLFTGDEPALLLPVIQRFLERRHGDTVTHIGATEERTCAQCGRAEHPHPFRHPFVPREAPL